MSLVWFFVLFFFAGPIALAISTGRTAAMVVAGVMVSIGLAIVAFVVYFAMTIQEVCSTGAGC